MRSIDDFVRQVLPGKMQIAVEPGVPIRAVGHVVDHAAIRNIDRMVTRAVILTQLLLCELPLLGQGVNLRVTESDQAVKRDASSALSISSRESGCKSAYA